MDSGRCRSLAATVTTTDAQVRKLMAEFNKCGRIGSAGLKAGIDRKTASKYVSAGKLPSELVEDRHWRTRQDPFAEHWPWVEERLREAPKLEARTLFDELRRLHPERYKDGQLRTLQRQARRWRAQRGPEREIFFPQEHLTGQLAQTDFTSTDELGITISGEVFAHLLCNFVQVYSNWQWLTVCLSESFLAVKRGVQEALHRLDHVPAEHQTDNSTAATHQEGTKRTFNESYVALMNHYNMRYRTTGIGQKEQNGDVEASNGALKRKLEQELLLRGSRDFETVDAYEKWLEERQTRWNALERAAFCAVSGGATGHESGRCASLAGLPGPALQGDSAEYDSHRAQCVLGALAAHGP